MLYTFCSQIAFTVSVPFNFMVDGIASVNVIVFPFVRFSIADKFTFTVYVISSFVVDTVPVLSTAFSFLLESFH